MQSYTVALSDPRFEIRGHARLADGLLTVERARLARGSAIAEASGTLALSGSREFALQGRLERLDPAAFAKVPAGELNASFTAKGSLAKQPTGEALLEIAKSRYAGLAAQGRVALAAEGSRLTRTQADVSLGQTRLVASGTLGRAGDTLDVKLVSPDLAPIGRTFGLALGGRRRSSTGDSTRIAAVSRRWGTRNRGPRASTPRGREAAMASALDPQSTQPD